MHARALMATFVALVAVPVAAVSLPDAFTIPVRLRGRIQRTDAATDVASLAVKLKIVHAVGAGGTLSVKGTFRCRPRGPQSCLGLRGQVTAWKDEPLACSLTPLPLRQLVLTLAFDDGARVCEVDVAGVSGLRASMDVLAGTMRCHDAAGMEQGTAEFLVAR